jgi:hypothetical protein
VRLRAFTGNVISNTCPARRLFGAGQPMISAVTVVHEIAVELERAWLEEATLLERQKRARRDDQMIENFDP